MIKLDKDDLKILFVAILAILFFWFASWMSAQV